MADVFESALEVVESMRAKRTVEHYRVATRDFLEFFGEDVRWQDVTHVRLREWKDWLCEPRARAPRGLATEHLRKRAEMIRKLCEIYRQTQVQPGLPDIEVMFNRYVDWSNPMNRKSVVTMRNRLERGDLPRVLERAAGADWPRWWRLLVFSTICTGLRKEGLAQLTWEVAPDQTRGIISGREGGAGWRITVEEKGRNHARSVRTIPVPRVLEEELRAWWEGQGRPETGSIWGLPLPRFGNPRP